MPWLDDMKAMSAAIAQPAGYGQQDAAPVQEQGREIAARTGTVKADGRAEERRRDMETLFEAAQEGKMTMDEAVAQFRAKWYGGKPPDMQNNQAPGKDLAPYLGPGGLGEKMNWPPRR
jgi:hypothetical protein